MGCNFDLSDIDFHGYATKNDVVCADGRIIRHDAFAENDGAEVPLVWGHPLSHSVSFDWGIQSIDI